MEFRVTGQKELERKLKHLGDKMGPEIQKINEQAAEYVRSQIPKYPPPPPNSTYKRTGRLGRWAVRPRKQVSSGGGFSFSAATGQVRVYVSAITARVPYAAWVVSKRRVDGVGPQAKVHKRNNWWTIQDVARDASKGVRKIYEDGIKRLLRS